MGAEVSFSTWSVVDATKYSRKMMFFAQNNQTLTQFGQVPEGIELGWKDAVFTRIVPIPQSTTPTTVSGSVGTFTATLRTKCMQVGIAPVKYADGEYHDLFDSRRSFINWVEAASRAYGMWLSKYVAYNLVKEISLYAYHIRADGNTEYSVSGVTTGVGTTTLIACTGRTEATDFWANGYITFTSGVNTGVTGTVASSVASTSITLDTSNSAASALLIACGTGDTFRVTVATGLADTSECRLNIKAVSNAVRILRDNEAETFDGYYIGAVDAANEQDFLIGHVISTAQYTTQGIDKIFKNEIGIYMGIRWVRVYELYREDADSTENRGDGLISNVLIFGKEAFGEIPFAVGSNVPELIVKNPGAQATGVTAMDGNLQMFVGASAVSAPKCLVSTYIVSIMTYPTVI